MITAQKPNGNSKYYPDMNADDIALFNEIPIFQTIERNNFPQNMPLENILYYQGAIRRLEKKSNFTQKGWY